MKISRRIPLYFFSPRPPRNIASCPGKNVDLRVDERERHLNPEGIPVLKFLDDAVSGVRRHQLGNARKIQIINEHHTVCFLNRGIPIRTRFLFHGIRSFNRYVEPCLIRFLPCRMA